MKKILLSMIAIFAMTICGFAQMPVCADACAPHANDADYSTGVIPTYPTAFAPLTVGVPVDECISIKIPNQISGSAISSALGFINITVNTVTVNGLVGLPDGLEACASENPMAANGTYTLRITGTPTRAGEYPLNMRAELDGPGLTSMANTYTNSESGVSTNITITVEGGEPAPVANFTTNPEAQNIGIDLITIRQRSSITFTNTSTNAHHIDWTFEGGDPATSNENTVAVAYNETPSGLYFTATLTAYNENETISDSKSVYVMVTPDITSVDENAMSEINVYPNPTSSVINIAAEGMQNITIMDMTGRVVMSKEVNSNFETISTEGFAKANYMVRIATADGVVVKNIVVE